MTSPPEAGEVPAPHRGKQAAAAVVTVVVLVVVFAGILPALGDYSAAWDTIAAASWVEIAVLGVVVVVSILVYVLPFQVALPGIGFRPAFLIRQAGFTIANAVPAGGAFGVGVQYAMAAQAGFTGAQASAAIGITSVFNLLVTLALPVLGIVAVLFVRTPTAGEIAGAIGGVVLIGVLVGFFALVLRSEHSARRLGGFADRAGEWALARVGRSRSLGVADQLVAFRTATVDVVAQRWVALSAANLGQQVAQFAVLAVALRIVESGTNEQVPLAAAFAAFGLARLASFIPVTPGGLGTVDAGLTALLVTFGATNDEALAATLLWRAASWVPQVFVGVICLAGWRLAAGRRPDPSAAERTAS